MRLARAPQKLIHHGNGYLGNLFALFVGPMRVGSVLVGRTFCTPSPGDSRLRESLRPSLSSYISIYYIKVALLLFS